MEHDMTATATAPDRLAWLEWRNGGIGGSDIAALLGLSRYGSPWSLFADKCGLLPIDETSTPRQRIGTRMESVLADEFHDMTGLFVMGSQTWCEMPDRTYFRCTVDGFVVEAPPDPFGERIDDPIGTVQFKTDGRFGWPDGPPANIRAQCVWEMGVTGLRHCWLVVMFAGFRVEVFEIDWDADTAADWDLMVDRAETFWTDHVLTGTPPPADDSDATHDALRAVFPEHVEGEQAELDGLADLIVERADLKDRESATKARLKFIDNTIKAALGEAEIGVLHGLPAFTYRTSEVAGYVVEPRTQRTLRPVKTKPSKED